MSIQLHPRTMIVARARSVIAQHICEVWEREQLTPLEVVSILAGLTSDHVRWPMRDERHPNDPNKKADEA